MYTKIHFFKTSLKSLFFDYLIVVDSFEKALTISSKFKHSIFLIEGSHQRFIFLDDFNIAVVSSYGALTEVSSIAKNRDGSLFIERSFLKRKILSSKRIFENILRLISHSKKVVFVLDSKESVNVVVSFFSVSKSKNKFFYIIPNFLSHLVKDLKKSKKISSNDLQRFELEDLFSSKFQTVFVRGSFVAPLTDNYSSYLIIDNNFIDFPVELAQKFFDLNKLISNSNIKFSLPVSVDVSIVQEDIVGIKYRPPFSTPEFLSEVSKRLRFPVSQILSSLMNLYSLGFINNPSSKISFAKYLSSAKKFVNLPSDRRIYRKDFFLLPEQSFLDKNSFSEFLKSRSFSKLDKTLLSIIRKRFFYSLTDCSGVMDLFDVSVSSIFSEIPANFERSLLVDVSCHNFSSSNLFDILDVFSIGEGSYKGSLYVKFFPNSVAKNVFLRNFFNVFSSTDQVIPFLTSFLNSDDFVEDTEYFVFSNVSRRFKNMRNLFYDFLQCVQSKKNCPNFYKLLINAFSL